jgi:Ca2+/H+ antiporter, TMEM165/GDT1 family
MPFRDSNQVLDALEHVLGASVASGVVAFVLVGLAEMGDKSQLVCMSLAARYRPWPVLAGAAVAFASLNALAVGFGAAVAAWLPDWLLTLLVAALFGAFGLHALMNGFDSQHEDSAPEQARASRSIFLGTLAIIFIAEFGDKTQIATAGLGAAGTPLAVWVGATLGVTAVAGIAVLAGRTLLRRLPIHLLHRLSGVLFLALAALALLNLWLGGGAT